MKLKINVTEKDIKEGKKDMPNSCPIARAVNRRLNKNSYALIYSNWITFYNRNNSQRQAYERVQGEVSTFIHQFDRGKVVKPLTFNLEIPKSCL